LGPGNLNVVQPIQESRSLSLWDVL